MSPLCEYISVKHFFVVAAVVLKRFCFLPTGMMDLFIGGEQPLQKRHGESTHIHLEFEIEGSAYLGRY